MVAFVDDDSTKAALTTDPGHTRIVGHEHAQVGRYLRSCQVCGTSFVAAKPQALYCSATCKKTVLLRKRHEAGRQRHHRRCPRCGNVFVARRADGVYCSGACRQAMHWRRHHVGR